MSGMEVRSLAILSQERERQSWREVLTFGSKPNAGI